MFLHCLKTNAKAKKVSFILERLQISGNTSLCDYHHMSSDLFPQSILVWTAIKKTKGPHPHQGLTFFDESDLLFWSATTFPGYIWMYTFIHLDQEFIIYKKERVSNWTMLPGNHWVKYHFKSLNRRNPWHSSLLPVEVLIWSKRNLTQWLCTEYIGSWTLSLFIYIYKYTKKLGIFN